MDFLTITLILASLYIGWNIGANNSADCLGASVGAGVMGFRKAAILAGVFALIGAVVQGSKTINTVGNGIINPGSLTQLSLVCALLGASLLVTFFTQRGLPVSVTHAVIGALVGIGIFTNSLINWGTITKLVIAWMLTPIIAAFFSYVAYRVIANILNRFNLGFVQKNLYVAVVGSGIFLAYTLGANNIGNAIGFVVSTNLMSVMLASMLGGIFLAIGSITFSKRVMKTVGHGITELDSWMAFSAQTGAAITLYILTFFGMPTSITTAVVGGVVGVGLVKGVAAVDRWSIFRILRGWITTPLLGGVLAIMLFKLLELL